MRYLADILLTLGAFGCALAASFVHRAAENWRFGWTAAKLARAHVLERRGDLLWLVALACLAALAALWVWRITRYIRAHHARVTAPPAPGDEFHIEVEG